MRLVTSCPACNAAFYVSAGQLKAHQGNVRCGHCEQVFNALERLASVDNPTAAEEQPLHDSDTDKIPDFVTAASQDDDMLSDEGAEPDSAVTCSTVRPILADDAALKLTDFSIPGNASLLSPAMLDDAVKSKAGIERQKNPMLLKLMLVLTALLMFLLLLAQAVYFLRSDIAAHWPQIRPHLEQTCVLLNCMVELPKNADLIAIDDSDLQEDADRQGLIHLDVNIINHAGYSQAYPLLELTLTDNRDKPLLRRMFKPEEYLPAGLDHTLGFAAKNNVRIKLSFTADNQAIAGYRLFLTY